ncbi:MAG TPA: hypothetical protein VM143_06125 [Acidimicrobiales bacterium]|nr:hypothetical protein [Acidimicrobiales bacterium]
MTGPIRITALYTAAFVAFSVARGDRRIVAYLLVIATAAAVVALVHRRHRVPTNVAYALSACGLLHVAGGLLPGHPVFYEAWLLPHVLKYDQLVHFTITATITVAVLATGLAKRPLVAVAMALAAGIGNEVFEYLSSLRYADAYVGGSTNAAWDLVFDTFGAATAAVVLLGRRGNPLARSVRLPRRVHVGVATPEGDELVV